jgi:hypothetical protein
VGYRGYLFLEKKPKIYSGTEKIAIKYTKLAKIYQMAEK